MRARFAFAQALLRAALVAALFAGTLAILPALALARHHRGAVEAPAPGPREEESASQAHGALSAPFVAACVMEPTTGTVIFEKDMHKPWPPASMAKMMLMLIVAEKLRDGSLKLTDQISASRKASQMGGSQVYLKEGESFSLDDMMKAVVVHSANDASVAVAEYLGGSTDAFVQMMNQRAAELGMKDTHYYSVHGLPPGPGQQSDITSAYDSAILARELVKYPQVLSWSSIDVAGFRNGTFELRNTNHLIRTFRGCDGLKTGFYYASGFNVTATAKRSALRLIAVVMGSPRKQQNFEQAATLLSQGFLNYFMYAVAKKGAPADTSVAVVGGTRSSFKPVWGQDLSVFVKHGEERNGLRINYDLPGSISAPVKSGKPIGRGTIIVDGKTAGSASLVAPADIPRASLLVRLLQKL